MIEDLEGQFRILEARYNRIADLMNLPASNVEFFSHDALMNFFFANVYGSSGISALIYKRLFGSSFSSGREPWRSYMCPDPYDIATWSQYTVSDWQAWQTARYGFVMTTGTLRDYLYFKPLSYAFEVAHKFLDDMHSTYARSYDYNFSPQGREYAGSDGYADALTNLSALPWTAQSSESFVGWRSNPGRLNRWTLEEFWGDEQHRTTFTNYDPYDDLPTLATYASQLDPHVGWFGTFLTGENDVDLGTAVGMSDSGFESVDTYDITQGITQSQIHSLLVAAGERAGHSYFQVSANYGGLYTIIDFSDVI